MSWGISPTLGDFTHIDLGEIPHNRLSGEQVRQWLSYCGRVESMFLEDSAQLLLHALCRRHAYGQLPELLEQGILHKWRLVMFTRASHFTDGPELIRHGAVRRSAHAGKITFTRGERLL